MIDILENIGDYFSQHFFNDEFPKKVFEKSGFTSDHIKEFTKTIAPLSEKYYRFKNDYLALRRKKDKILKAHQFHTELLDALGYINGTEAYSEPVMMDDDKIIPVRFRFNKNDKPYLYVMEMQPMIKEGDIDPDGLYEQSYLYDDWEKVLPSSWVNYEIRPEVIKEALSELFLLPEEERPVYLIMLAGPKIFLIQYEKWKFDSYLLFDLEKLFDAAKISANRNLLALLYALLAKKQFISETESILSGLEEDAHKASYGVTVALKSAVIYAVEALANEAIQYRLSTAETQEDKRNIVQQLNSETFAKELKDDCLTFVYRLLFLFYAESREDLEILPVKDSTYQKGYSLEMLRDLEMVALTTEASMNGFFFSESLWKLFNFLHKGSSLKDGFELRPLDSPLFDNEALHHLKGIQFRNKVLQEIIVRLSLSERTRNKGRGRISYSNLGINQLGSVYESLLAYSGFFASENLIEVKKASDATGKEGTFLVPKSRRDDFKETEILKQKEHPEEDVIIEKGQFVYRLNGRDRKNSASYYTPEVLTQCTVKYTLKGIIDRLKEKQAIVDGELTGEPCADEILELKILEPAMGAAAFHNEVINQLAVAYLELKENEQQAIGRKRITPGDYKDELQKVKAYIAANNVYGVDLNPTAVELGKLSLWLNCMHKNMETPFFAHRLGAGNAVVGAWLKVYNDKDCLLEFPTEGTAAARRKPIPKSWWEKAPKRVSWNKNGKLNRKENQIYHFLLPDDNMVPSFGIRLLKDELTDEETRAFRDWKRAFKEPLSKTEIVRLQKISSVIDYLLEEHYTQQKGVIADTSSVYQVYGQPNPQMSTRGYDEKERLSESRNNRSAPYYKLKTVMDYWCSLWFWDVREVRLLPTRTEWYNEIESILQIDTNNLTKDSTDQGIKELIRTKARAGSLFDNTERIDKVVVLAQQHRYFHNEIEFIEVFKERGGFDVIVGNPPWVNITMDEAGIIGEKFPEVIIRKFTAPKTKRFADRILPKDLALKSIYSNEFIEADSLKTYLGTSQNYYLLQGQRNNLYKCILNNTLQILSKNGYSGLIHPEGIYDDPKAENLRSIIFKKLKYHFQFRNEFMLFSDVMHTRNYSINVYSSSSDKISFYNINNLFHPNTIEESFNHSGSGICPGIKEKSEASGNFEWCTRPHKDRVVHLNDLNIRKLFGLSEQETNVSNQFLAIHSKQILSALIKLNSFKNKPIEKISSDGLNETNAPRDEVFTYDNFNPLRPEELIINGPNIYSGNPFYRTPRKECNKSSDYDIIDVEKIESNFLPRSIYKPNQDKYSHAFPEIFGKNWLSFFKCTFNKMLDSNVERTIKSCITLPMVGHTNGLISTFFKEEQSMIEFCGLSSSVVVDFLIKTSNKSNIYSNTIDNMPIGISDNYKSKLILRTLLLNSLNGNYSELWRRNWSELFVGDSWSKEDNRLKSFGNLTKEWEWNTPLRNWFERRQALVEVDVISAISLGLSLAELILMYEAHFPVLQQNEEDTWYDAKGNIVFTVSKGLVGVGVDRGDWNQIKDLKAGETYEHTITKSQLYHGKKVTYYAPFDKCDRVEDYKVAWAHFEKVFNQENN